jgi:trans-aconitate 2-methyltransferase
MYLDVERIERTVMWDPAQYLHFAGERSRPFYDLAGRIGAAEPGWVVDLGCGPGQLTASLAERWPVARVTGIDSSAEMISAAQQADYGESARSGRLAFAVGDVTDWKPERPADVIISNAVLQWVPGHLELLPRWAGYLAVQLNRQAGDPEQYLDLLAGEGLRVDAWETTYLHVLQGPDPVTDWYRGTGLRPVLTALDSADAEEFTRQYGERIRVAYPAAAYGTVLPFRRVFVVAHKA